VPEKLGPVALNSIGHRLQQQGRYAEAEPYLRRAVEKRSGYAYAEYNLGEALLRQGKTREALEHLQKTAAQQPDRWEPRARLAEAYAVLGQKDRAAQYSAEAKQLRVGRHPGRRRRADLDSADTRATAEHAPPDKRDAPRRPGDKPADRAKKPADRAKKPADNAKKPAPADGEDFPLGIPTHVDQDSVLRPGPEPGEKDSDR
jgi:hypothetical protein